MYFCDEQTILLRRTDNSIGVYSCTMIYQDSLLFVLFAGYFTLYVFDSALCWPSFVIGAGKRAPINECPGAPQKPGSI